MGGPPEQLGWKVLGAKGAFGGASDPTSKDLVVGRSGRGRRGKKAGFPWKQKQQGVLDRWASSPQGQGKVTSILRPFLSGLTLGSPWEKLTSVGCVPGTVPGLKHASLCPLPAVSRYRNYPHSTEEETEARGSERVRNLCTDTQLTRDETFRMGMG